jgi:hypothetical protein
MNHIVQDNEVDFFASYPKDTPNHILLPFLFKFQPKIFIRSNEDYFSINHIPTFILTKSRHNMMCMYLNRNLVYHLFEDYKKKKNIQYDIVFSCRIDFIIHSKLDLNLIYQKSKEGYICIPKGEDHNGINDRMACGNEGEMKKYMTTLLCKVSSFPQVKDLPGKLTCYESMEYLLHHGRTLHPETMLREYFEYKEMKSFRYSLETHII